MFSPQKYTPSQSESEELEVQFSVKPTAITSLTHDCVQEHCVRVTRKEGWTIQMFTKYSHLSARYSTIPDLVHLGFKKEHIHTGYF